jgi:hypothetical protein
MAPAGAAGRPGSTWPSDTNATTFPPEAGSGTFGPTVRQRVPPRWHRLGGRPDCGSAVRDLGAGRDAITRVVLRRAGAILRREGVGLIAAGVALVIVLAFRVSSDAAVPTGREAFCYWLPDLADPYARSDWTQPVAYVYSPAFLQGIAGLKALPWEAFLAAWTTLLLLAVRYLVGPRLWAAGIVFAAFELLGGNIHLLLAAAIVAGFRWPAAWAFVLLTKVTPGVGLLWFAVRREWRNLGVALGATAVIAAVSWALAPGAWADWLDVLGASATKTAGTWAAVPVPVWLRLPFAIGLVAWGARTDRRWTVPVAAMIALPALWFGSASMLLAAVALATDRVRGGARPLSGHAGGSRPTWRPRFASVRAA